MTCPCESTASFFPPPCPPRSVYAFFWNISLDIGLTVQEARWIANYCSVPETTVPPATTTLKTSLTFNKTLLPLPTTTSIIPPLHPLPTTTSTTPHSASFDVWIIIVIIIVVMIISILTLAAFKIICRKRDVSRRYAFAFLNSRQISTDTTRSTIELTDHEENYGGYELPQENNTVCCTKMTFRTDIQGTKSSPVTKVNENYANDVREEDKNDSMSSHGSKSGSTSKPTPENKNSAIIERKAPHKNNVNGNKVYYHHTNVTKDKFQEMSFTTDISKEKADSYRKVHDNSTPEPPETLTFCTSVTTAQSEKDMSETLNHVVNQSDHALIDTLTKNDDKIIIHEILA